MFNTELKEKTCMEHEKQLSNNPKKVTADDPPSKNTRKAKAMVEKASICDDIPGIKKLNKTLEAKSIESNRRAGIEQKQQQNIQSKIHSNTLPSFVYESKGNKLVFHCMSNSYIMKCHNCNVETKYIGAHITNNKKCQHEINITEFKKQFKQYKLRDEDQEKMKEKQRKWKAASRAKSKYQEIKKKNI